MLYNKTGDFMRVYHELEPIYNESSKVLILGSLPSVKSREVGFYYAHPQNRFWRILESLFGVSLPDIDAKKKFLLSHRIALWDTVASCEISGSSDASIKNIEVNDLTELLQNSQIEFVFCTGRKAYDLYQKYMKPNTNIDAFLLPSPSAANAKCSLPSLVSSYQVILDCLNSVS